MLWIETKSTLHKEGVIKLHLYMYCIVLRNQHDIHIKLLERTVYPTAKPELSCGIIIFVIEHLYRDSSGDLS